MSRTAPVDAAPTTQAFTIVFDPHDEYGEPRPTVVEVNFGPADGSIRKLLVTDDERRGVQVLARGTTHDWIVDDGHLRRLRAYAGSTLHVRLGALAVKPLVEGSRGLVDRDGPWLALSLRTLASTPFEEAAESDELTIWGGDRTSRSHPGSPSRMWRLHGRVLAADGAAATDFFVQVVGNGTRTVLPAFGNRFEAAALPSGTYTVSVASRSGGRAEQSVQLAADTAIDLVLQHGPEVRGRVIDHGGQPVAKAQVLWSTPDGDWHNHVVTAADGSFVVADIANTPGSLWICAPAEGSQLPATGRSAAPGDALALVIDRERCRGSLRVHVNVPDGVSSEGVSARLWQQASGIGVRLVAIECTVHAAKLGRDDIPAGQYRLELYCPGYGVIDAGAHWLDGTSRVTLDRFALSRPGHVEFTLPMDAPVPAANAFVLVRVGTAVDVRIPTEQPFAGPHALGPGRYTIWWRDAASAVRSHTFEVAAGGDLVVALPD